MFKLGNDFETAVPFEGGINNPCAFVEMQSTVNNRPIKCALSLWKYNDNSEFISFPDLILHPNELSYLHSGISDRRKTEYIAGRVVAKHALSSFFDKTNPQKIEIARGLFNQPIVKLSSENIPEISISHKSSIATALASPSGHLMGIDIEEHCERNLPTLASQLSTAEKQLIIKNGSYQLAYSQLWSIKEALSKVLKTGLTSPFNIYETSEITFKNSLIDKCYFKNFYQYEARSWVFDKYTLAIVLPRNSSLTLNTDQLSLHITRD